MNPGGGEFSVTAAGESWVPVDSAFLGEFRGYLQADAYAGYDALYATGRIIEVGCMAHARRYFFHAKASDPARALPALGFIQQLYAVEREVKGADARRGARGGRPMRGRC